MNTGFSKLNWRGQVAWAIIYFQQSQSALAVFVALINMASNMVILFKLPTALALGLNFLALPFLIIAGWVWAHHGPVKAQSEVPFLDGLDTRTKVGMALSVLTLERLGVDMKHLNPDVEIEKIRHLMTSTKDECVQSVNTDVQKMNMEGPCVMPPGECYLALRRHAYDA